MPETLDDLRCPPSNWSCVLTPKNAGHIARWLHALLAGKECVFVSMDNLDPNRPRIQSEMGHLEPDMGNRKKILVDCEIDDERVVIKFSATDGYFHMYTSYAPFHHDDFKNAVFRFEEGKVTIRYRAPAGTFCTEHIIPIRPQDPTSYDWSRSQWTWSEEQQAYLHGSRQDGAGVYEEENGTWSGNVVHPTQCFFVGPRNTLEEIQKEALKVLAECRAGACA